MATVIKKSEIRKVVNEMLTEAKDPTTTIDDFVKYIYTFLSSKPDKGKTLGVALGRKINEFIAESADGSEPEYDRGAKLFKHALKTNLG